MKQKTTTGFKAIAKILFAMCAVSLAVSVNAQADYDKGREFHKQAAILLDKAENTTNDSLKEARLTQAAAYTDSAELYYRKEHARLVAQTTSKKNNEDMKLFYTQKDASLGKDTTDIHVLRAEIEKGLKWVQKRRNNDDKNTSSQNSSNSSSEKKDSLINTEMTGLSLHGPDKQQPKAGKTDSTKQLQKSVTEPENKNQANTGQTSKIIITDAPSQTENKSIVEWEFGADAGITWTAYPAVKQSYIHLTDNFFGAGGKGQQLTNDGTAFPDVNAIKITTYPGWQLSANAGCVINRRFQINLAIGGGTFSSKAELPVTVATMVPPSSPSAPPTTKQGTETLQEKILSGNFNTRLTGRAYFGNKIRGYVEAGGVVGLNYCNMVKITAPGLSENIKNLQTTVYGGGTVGAGLSIMLTPMLSFETGVNTGLLDIQKKFAASVGATAGVKIVFGK